MSKHYASLFLGKAEGGEEASRPAERYQLLLVDDEPGVLAALRRVFQRQNYQLHFARNGIEALKMLESIIES